jgi:hypothetical protein
MAMERAEVIADHKLRQAQRLRDNVAGPEYFQSMRDDVHELAARIERVPDQLYVQSTIQTLAISRALRMGPLHFAQTDPPTLGSFVWHVDRKDRDIVESEKLWRDLEKPFIQTISLEKPALYVEGGHFDYSAMEKFQNPTLAGPPAHLAAARESGMKGPFESSNLRPLVDNLSFEDSKDSPGIQFADVLANAFCRACNGRLDERGWKDLRHLMIRDAQQKAVIEYVTLGPEGRRPVDTRAYGDVALRIERNARPFLFPPAAKRGP